jgi:hypothetical protein
MTRIQLGLTEFQFAVDELKRCDSEEEKSRVVAELSQIGCEGIELLMRLREGE